MNNPIAFDSPLRKRIREFRNLRGLTQKELGEMCGLNESTIRNYELGNRYPDEETLYKLADHLGIDVLSLSDPDSSTAPGAAHMLFELEKKYNLIPKVIDGKIHLVLDDVSEDFPTNIQLQRLQLWQSLALWSHVRQAYDNGDLLDEEYDKWKNRFPDLIDKTHTYGYIDDPGIAARVKKLSKKALKATTNQPDPAGETDPRKAKRRHKPPKDL